MSDNLDNCTIVLILFTDKIKKNILKKLFINVVLYRNVLCKFVEPADTVGQDLKN